MKKTVMICDRCGKQYDPKEESQVGVSDILNLRACRVRVTVCCVGMDDCRRRKQFDLCPKCAEHITGELVNEAVDVADLMVQGGEL